jgi:uncharacterized membrane protein YbhN (UPF0104 family)
VTRWWRDNRQNLARLGGTLLAVAMIVVLVHEEGSGEIVLAMKGIPLRYFLAAGLVMVISRLFVAGRWHALLHSAGVGISPMRTTMLTFTGLFSSNFLPTTIGGDVVRLAGAMQLGYDRAICLASLVVDRLVGMAGMALTLPFGLLPVLSIGVNGLQSIALAGLFEKVMGFVRRTMVSFAIWWKNPIGLLLSFLSTTGNMACIFWAVYLLISGLGHPVSYWLIAGLWSLTYFVTLIPISINGYGLQELSLSLLLSHVGGLSDPESVTIALLIRALFIITSLPGAFFLPAILSAMTDTQEKATL